MRLWSINPRYLDRIGLVALWREGLLSQKVLLGLTKGYKNHSQLVRFSAHPDPLLAIGFYLAEVFRVAEGRGYKFDGAKIARHGDCPQIDVTEGQIKYEWQHLLGKLQHRAPDIYAQNKELISPEAHPLFRIVPGGIEDWERV